jgi:hypothetical protein
LNITTTTDFAYHIWSEDDSPWKKCVQGEFQTVDAVREVFTGATGSARTEFNISFVFA